MDISKVSSQYLVVFKKKQVRSKFIGNGVQIITAQMVTKDSSSYLEKEQICQSLHWLINSESLPHKLNTMFKLLLERLHAWFSLT